ncbi:hypothetical protein [Mucilaginibacter psychrotolerans]|uniref:Uncharacterized protein n=1 Tax=Mucilaginibacter psychrotolerans TaxID=1524096 RepID=A0A4Y8SLW3_9SPHI|nr:hypothetical protein [Mucilaginibacter psychrotolerans]TFF40069.1 hypothetical protein E2R66_02110 [Mucilaginibacter psychrotolerans]
MKKLLLFVCLLSVAAVTGKTTHRNDTIPEFMQGKFKDDYGIKYEINDTLWFQLPKSKFRIIKWNLKEQYLVARNGDGNPGDGGLYTRIDFMEFKNMSPWKWGYCLTAYDAPTDIAAEAMAKADRKHPKTGCNGFPFSRMKVND